MSEAAESNARPHRPSTAAAQNLPSTADGGPGVDALLRRWFFNRTDRVAILAPWGKPCPAVPEGTLEDLLRAHTGGDAAPLVRVACTHARSTTSMEGRFRLGSYAPALDGTTGWLCIDLDGPGHASALADPDAAARRTLGAFEAAGLPAYLERSGGGAGWHVWCFFAPPIPASEARALGRALAPPDAPLAGGGIADVVKARGIEVFPKQTKIRPTGYGHAVWLPWWHGAPGGANQFYERGSDDVFRVHVPRTFEPASPDALGLGAAADGPCLPDAVSVVPADLVAVAASCDLRHSCTSLHHRSRPAASHW